MHKANVNPSSIPIRLPWQNVSGYYCFGCCGENPAGLGLTFYRQGDGLAATLITTRRHESYPGVTHGGITMALLDEVMGNSLGILEQRFCFTIGIRVRFVAPMVTSRAYCASARIVERAGPSNTLYKVEGEVTTTEGQIIATATGTYKWVDVAHANATFAACNDEGQLIRYLRPNGDESVGRIPEKP